MGCGSAVSSASTASSKYVRLGEAPTTSASAEHEASESIQPWVPSDAARRLCGDTDRRQSDNGHGGGQGAIMEQAWAPSAAALRLCESERCSASSARSLAPHSPLGAFPQTPPGALPRTPPARPRPPPSRSGSAGGFSSGADKAEALQRCSSGGWDPMDYSPCGPDTLTGEELASLRVAPASYEHLRPIDSTSNSTVYLAELQKGGLVAVKRIEKKASRQPLSMHVNEARVLLFLGHPCIVQLVGVAETPEVFEMLFEYCAGGRLTLCAREMSRGQLLQVLTDAASALECMHARSFVHLDVKPDNVLLASGRGKLCDFGTCTGVGPSRMLCAYLGTVGYRAPEVGAGQNFDGMLADVWSLGRVVEFVEEETDNSWPNTRTMLMRNPSGRPVMSKCLHILECYYSNC